MLARTFAALALFIFFVFQSGFIDSFLSLNSTVDKRGGHNSGDGFSFAMDLMANSNQVDDKTFARECDAELSGLGRHKGPMPSENVVLDMFSACLVEPNNLTADLSAGFCESEVSPTCPAVEILNPAAAEKASGKSSLSCKQHFESLMTLCPKTVDRYQKIFGKPNTLTTPMIRTYHAD